MSIDIVRFGKEIIEEEIRALNRLKDALNENFEKAVNLILGTTGKVIITGIGKSGIIGKKIASTFSSTGTPSFFLHPAEAIHGDLGMVEKEDLIIAISNSGESPELIAIIPTLKRWGNKIIAITNNPNSTLAKNSDIVLHLNIDKEACPLNLAPTSSTTATLVLGDALASTLLTIRNFKKEHFAEFHPGGALGKKLMKVSQIMHTGEKLPIVPENTPLQDAIITMSEKGFGAVLIVDKNNHLKGILTDGDLRRFIKKGGSIDKSKVEDAMTISPKYITEDMLVLEALEIMERYKITVLPVVKDNIPIGLVHLHDILKSGVV
ncbi:KpsF/GutQ family sugar-phosphate isomerase [Venenivibrio stagnispumantis]|uniref:Arabinose-5-phosphate isomerase n=1 Tax=Venenivibrio stagnispumantis TaxID=407998 RepID=A0AA45WN86_9AQUI|nr:KpsF/GutQ family sugar-phosphate isomerase [Venenivibrio stagnispumantis]MCW4573180.1 KpsF/GutQ family sugar-phosphate isomerase [Venenivibrio stagnispumantis]SMP17780.1 arabinose-5-phosphate isomerase [Venenivibrio stagnispumantis]